MIVAVSGTPGTGKTAVSRELAELLDYDYIDVNAVAEQEGVETADDLERDTVAVDMDSLIEALQREVGEDAVLDGHLSHHYPADFTVVLRCAPAELEHRLQEKGWDEPKIRENVEAEALDVILQEAVTAGGQVMEIDTTGEQAADVAETIQDVVDSGEVPEEYRPGHVQWDVGTAGENPG